VLRYSYITTATHGNCISVLAFGPETPTVLPPVYFVHPINLRKEFWLDVMRELAVDRMCYAVDSAGHGESSDSAEYGIEVWVRDHVEVIEALGLEQLHLVGGSLGGAIIVGIAAELPDRTLSLASFGGRLLPDALGDGDAPDLVTLLEQRGRDEVFHEVAIAATAPGTAADIVETVFYLTNAHGTETIRNLWAGTIASDASRWAPDVKCTALIVNGEFDATCTPEMGRVLADAVRGTFVGMPGLGHLPALEDPSATLALITANLTVAEALAS
jgi:pimeloyl-ACP methyl ester carboxylesterase